MEELRLREGESFIRLSQAMKKAGLVSSGSDAAYHIANEQVRVNGETETRRGRKLYTGDSFSFGKETIRIIA